MLAQRGVGGGPHLRDETRLVAATDLRTAAWVWPRIKPTGGAICAPAREGGSMDAEQRGNLGDRPPSVQLAERLFSEVTRAGTQHTQMIGRSHVIYRKAL